jgi:hypothetical protein
MFELACKLVVVFRAFPQKACLSDEQVKDRVIGSRNCSAQNSLTRTRQQDKLFGCIE